VYGAGAFQTLVNRDLIKPTDKLFIVGGGNVGLIGAYHALQAGVDVIGIVEALPFVGGYKVHLDKIKRLGIPVYTSHTVLRAEGNNHLERVMCRDNGFTFASWNVVTNFTYGKVAECKYANVFTIESVRSINTYDGDTTEDRQFSLGSVNCLGACALGPVVVIDGHYFSRVKETRVRHLLEEAREGFSNVEKEKDKRVFPLEVSCPRCNHSLMDRTVTIDNYPSIRVVVAFDEEHGWLRLSSLYGSHNIESEHEVPPGKVVDFFCPHCHAELVDTSDCPTCSAPMVPMIVHGGGTVGICSRRGCRSHGLALI